MKYLREELCAIRFAAKRGEIIESFRCPDFNFCKCKAVVLNGGNEYLRRCGNREY